MHLPTDIPSDDAQNERYRCYQMPDRNVQSSKKDEVVHMCTPEYSVGTFSLYQNPVAGLHSPKTLLFGHIVPPRAGTALKALSTQQPIGVAFNSVSHGFTDVRVLK